MSAHRNVYAHSKIPLRAPRIDFLLLFDKSPPYAECSNLWLFYFFITDYLYITISNAASACTLYFNYLILPILPILKKKNFMKNLFFATLMLLSINLPTNADTKVANDSLSVLSLLEFKINNKNNDNINDDYVKPYSLLTVVSGKLYTNGQLELTFDSDEAVTVSVTLNGAEMIYTEFLPDENIRTLTFDLDDYGKGAYDVNVSMPDGSVQTAEFDY